MGLCAGCGHRRFAGGDQCMDYSLHVSVKRECGGGE